MKSVSKILIIMPAYNEEKVINYTLSKLFSIKKDLQEKMQASIDICVVNDGSIDLTAKIASSYDVILLNLVSNSGIGKALQKGYQYAYENNYDIAIQFDADGQHNEEDLANMIEPLLKNECDMVIGSRFLQKTSYKGSLIRRIAIFYFYNLLYLLIGRKFTDPTSGFRAKNKKIIEIFSQDCSSDYPESASLVYLHKKNLRMKEISVNMRKRQGGTSSIPPYKYLYFLVKVSYLMIKASLIDSNKKT